MARYGFTPQPGTDYSTGEEPELARRLGQLGRALHRHLLGISGYRSPSHSVSVGGFANDPHTRGQASDTGGVEDIPEATLRRYGLTRPFPGAREANHIQLLGGARGSTRAPRTTREDGPADWLKQAGWPTPLIPVMVAIGGAESGWRVNAESPKNANGTVDYGWLQINSVHGYDPTRLKSDPVYTARAAKQIYKDEGLGAWSTYNNGAYKSFMGRKPTGATFGRTRPGGDTGEGDGPDTELASFWDAGLSPPGFINPLNLFKGAGKAISGTTDFLKWVAWIFHPLNILRVVEFNVGFSLIVMGLAAFAMVWNKASGENPVKMLGRVVSKSPTPVGRAVKVARKL